MSTLWVVSISYGLKGGFPRREGVFFRVSGGIRWLGVIAGAGVFGFFATAAAGEAVGLIEVLEDDGGGFGPEILSMAVDDLLDPVGGEVSCHLG